ncbi:MAG: hypothetical protein V3T59_09180 [Desulfobacterales bacterium]
MVAYKVLLPYNFTAYEKKSLAFVIDTFSHREDVQITLFNTYTPLPNIDMEGSPELAKMKKGLTFLSQELEQKEEGLKSAKTFLIENGFSEDQVNCVFQKKEKSLADDIVDMILKEHYKVLVFSRQPGKVARFFTRSVHDKALAALESVTVCIAT